MTRGKRQKVLSAKTKAPQKLQDIYDANGTDSPLLRLPPEVRTRIYRFALGGQTIHVEPAEKVKEGFFPFTRYREPKLKFRAYVCQHDTNDREDASTIKADRKVIWKSHSSRHAGCSKPLFWKRPATKVSVGMLQACRQIHQEAALLPFANNTFSFSNPTVLHDFLRFIILHQARAITSISLVVQARTESLNPLSGLLKSKLKGLKELTCFFELPDHSLYGSDTQSTAADMLMFQQCPIASATVVAHQTKTCVRFWQTAPPRVSPVPGDLLWRWMQWEEVVEGALTIDGVR